MRIDKRNGRDNGSTANINEGKEKMSLWLCGKTKEISWDLKGIFSTKELAIAQCKDKKDFIAPIFLNDIDEGEKNLFTHDGVEFPLWPEWKDEL